MLDIKKKTDGTKLTMVLTGRVDSETSYMVDDEVAVLPEDVTELVFDMKNLDYVSSSGLRALLMAAKKMDDRGGVCTMANVPELIMETFEMTGLLPILHIV